MTTPPAAASEAMALPLESGFPYSVTLTAIQFPLMESVQVRGGQPSIVNESGGS